MRFIIEQDNLVKALAKVQGSVEKKNTIPILANVKITTSANQISFITTDMDLMACCFCDAKITEEGSTTVNSQLLFDIVKKTKNGSELAFELEEKSILIKTGKTKFNLPVIEADEFPVIETGEIINKFSISASNFRQILEKTRFAVCDDSTRYNLSGIYFHSKEINGKKYIAAASTDGHKLASVAIKADEKFNDFEGVIIPKKTIGELLKITEDYSKTIEISTSRTKIKAESGNIWLLSKVIDAQFPDYEQIIPNNNPIEIKIEKRRFIDAIDRISTIAADKHRSIKFTVKKNIMEVSSKTVDGGFANEEIEIELKGYDKDDDFIVGFNSRYLIDILSVVDEEQVIMKLLDHEAPVIITSKNSNNIYVLMPVKV